jgi:NAD(P)-dependent dehydrogenase (short-subunit alcohol dehydrogenase family)
MDRVVLITGATGNLGRTAAAAFAADGARLILAGTDGERLGALASEVGLDPDRWAPLVVDLRDRDATREAIAAADRKFERIDVVLHLVGGFVGGTSIVDLDASDLQSMLDQHLWTTFGVVRAVVPGMVERGWGRILAVSAPVAAEPAAKMAAYGVGKAAEEVLLRTLARETAKTGVTVNVVVVKAIDTEGERASDPRKASWTTPEEITAVLRFLASDDAATITGARIPLFGRG